MMDFRELIPKDKGDVYEDPIDGKQIPKEALDGKKEEAPAESKDIPLDPKMEMQAQQEAAHDCSVWMQSHPKYTMDELIAAKHKFLEEARRRIAGK